ncbi:hypothetical protein ABIC45_001054 [Mucilaginibacter rubeus]
MEIELRIHHKTDDFVIKKDNSSIVFTLIDANNEPTEGFVFSFDQLITAAKEFKQREKVKFLSQKDTENS